MQSYDIALSGLKAATTSLDTIGHNIANSSTDGYHRERVNLSPVDSAVNGPAAVGSGVDISSVSRMIDTILEDEIRRQEGNSGQVDQELSTLTTIQSVLGELSSDGALSSLTDDFFNAIQDLSLHPEDNTYQLQFLNAAQALADQFNTIGNSLNNMQDNIYKEAQTTVENINEITSEISTLNQNIQDLTITGNPANSLMDQRDQLINQLSQLIGITTNQQDNGVINIQAGGIPLVAGTSNIAIAVGYATSSTIGLALGSSTSYQPTVAGGKLGGLVSSYNTIINDLQDDLDTLAQSIVSQFNQLHVQGGSATGAFSSLTGWQVDSATDSLEDLGLDITDGSFYIRITDADGNVERHEITVDAGTDTLTTIAADLTALTGITAGVSNGKLSITADSGYGFDFMPTPMVDDDSGLATSTSTPSISGIYTESSNDTFTFTVTSGGTVGNGTVTVAVTNSDSETIATLSLGSDYVAGDKIDLGNGIKVAFGAGTLVASEDFTVEGLADSDTADFLSAVGINTFFSGTSATSMSVLSRFTSDPSQLATALGSDYTDNANVSRMVDLATNTLTDLGDQSISDYYYSTVSSLGQDLAMKKVRSDNFSTTLQNLNDQQSAVSGVDINEETARVLVFEQMYQGVAHYLSSANDLLTMLSNLIGR